MKILCTFPGKYGDLLWALPTIRAISRRVGYPVHLDLGAGLASIVPLLQRQPYLATVHARADWETRDTAPISPRTPPWSQTQPWDYDAVLHLGYRDWPLPDVAMHTRQTAHLEGTEGPDARGLLTSPLTLDEWSFEPWITLPGDQYPDYRWPWLYGFTDEHFELKYGLVTLLERQSRLRLTGPLNLDQRRLPPTNVGYNPRWTQEAGCAATTWEQSVELLQHTSALLTCNSALHVLAVACGVPVVMVEPNPMRHNPVFYPLGMTGPEVTLVTGTDGLPTVDARHTYDALEAVLARAGTAQIDSPAIPPSR